MKTILQRQGIFHAEIGFCYVAQVGLQLAILMTLIPEFWGSQTWMIFLAILLFPLKGEAYKFHYRIAWGCLVHSLWFSGVSALF